jgi:hypothetical protein
MTTFCITFYESYLSMALPLYRSAEHSLESAGNVPAESTSPEPERFFGRKESSVPNSPFPNPNT